MKSILFILLSSIILSSCYSQDTILKDYVREPFHTRPMPKVPTIPNNKDSVFIKMWSGYVGGSVQYYAILYTLDGELYFANRNLFDFEDFDFRYNKPLYKAKVKIDSTNIPYEIKVLDKHHLEKNYNYIFNNDSLLSSDIPLKELNNETSFWAFYSTPIDSLLQPLAEINIAMQKAYIADTNTIGRWMERAKGAGCNTIYKKNNDYYMFFIMDTFKISFHKNYDNKIIIKSNHSSLYSATDITINNSDIEFTIFKEYESKDRFLPFDEYYYKVVLGIEHYRSDTIIPAKFYKTP